jgi:hypothetical protein
LWSGSRCTPWVQTSVPQKKKSTNDAFHIYIWKRTMKPIKIVLRMGGEGEWWWGESKIYCKCHNESPLYNYYMLINFLDSQINFRVKVHYRSNEFNWQPQLKYSIQ